MLTFLVKAVDAGNRCRLVVPAQDVDFIGVFDFVGKKEADCLDALASPVDVVAQEQVGMLGREASVLEEPEHVVVLSMDVPEDLDGGPDVEEHGGVHKQLLDILSDANDFVFLKVDVFAWLGVFGLKQGLDDAVDIDLYFLADHHSQINM